MNKNRFHVDSLSWPVSRAAAIYKNFISCPDFLNALFVVRTEFWRVPATMSIHVIARAVC